MYKNNSYIYTIKQLNGFISTVNLSNINCFYLR